MPAERVLSIIRRATLDDEFRAKLFANPDDALAEYDLSPDETAAIRRLQPEHIDSFVGGLVAQQFIPIRASRRFVIVAEGNQNQVSPPDLPIIVGPEIVFGNGLHPSTQLCVRELEKRVKPGLTVLDIGTGTGILAIAAARLGASPILAVDILPEAADAARRNVEMNGLVDQITVEHGSLAEALARGFRADIMVGNLLAPIIIALAGQGLSETLNPKGVMILAGLTNKQRGGVEAALRQNGLSVFARRRQGDWTALLARKRQGRVFW